MYEVLTQVCNECQKDLPLYEFGYSSSRGTHNKKCKECTKKRQKKWYKADPNLKFSRWSKKKDRVY